MSPEPASYDPEEFVDGSQPWPRLLAFKDGELLAKGEVFEHQTAARPKQAKHGSEPEPKQVKHGNQVIADRLCRLPCEVVDFTAGQDCDEGQCIQILIGSLRVGLEEVSSDRYRQTPKGLGMPLGLFRSGHPLDRMVATPAILLRACQPR